MLLKKLIKLDYYSVVGPDHYKSKINWNMSNILFKKKGHRELPYNVYKYIPYNI